LEKTMLAKITAKNQLTLPKSLTQAVGATEYFDVEARGGQLILTPVRIQRGDAVRAKLAELDLTEDDMAAAVAWARAPAHAVVNEPAAAYELTTSKPRKVVTKNAKPKA
jgi:antitoxin component of MazEF toxin-antitoxin module